MMEDEEYLYFTEIEAIYEKIIGDEMLINLLELQKKEAMKKFPYQYKEEFKRYVSFYQNKEWEEAKKQA